MDTIKHIFFIIAISTLVWAIFDLSKILNRRNEIRTSCDLSIHIVDVYQDDGKYYYQSRGGSWRSANPKTEIEKWQYDKFKKLEPELDKIGNNFIKWIAVGITSLAYLILYVSYYLKKWRES